MYTSLLSLFGCVSRSAPPAGDAVLRAFLAEMGVDPAPSHPDARANLGWAIGVERDSPAIRDAQLVESVGIETLGGTFTMVLPKGCAQPCLRTEIFSTAKDNQAAIDLPLFRGMASRTEDATALGTFALRDLPPAPRGVPQILVTFGAIEGALVLAARDRATDLPVRIEIKP